MDPSGGRPEASENGKVMAALSYGSFFLGFPIGLIPLIQRDDPFALYHAKHATAVWIVTFAVTIALVFVYTVLSFVTCGFGAILFPILLLPLPWMWAVAIHGLVLSLNGQYQEPIGGFGLGELMFGQVQLKEVAALPLPPSDQPPPPPPSVPPPPPA